MEFQLLELFISHPDEVLSKFWLDMPLRFPENETAQRIPVEMKRTIPEPKKIPGDI
ncbi:MAG: hypothetical protein ABII26_01655 [Pseudomonadota bacterium]